MHHKFITLLSAAILLYVASAAFLLTELKYSPSETSRFFLDEERDFLYGLVYNDQNIALLRFNVDADQAVLEERIDFSAGFDPKTLVSTYHRDQSSSFIYVGAFAKASQDFTLMKINCVAMEIVAKQNYTLNDKIVQIQAGDDAAYLFGNGVYKINVATLEILDQTPDLFSDLAPVDVALEYPSTLYLVNKTSVHRYNLDSKAFEAANVGGIEGELIDVTLVRNASYIFVVSIDSTFDVRTKLHELNTADLSLVKSVRVPYALKPTERPPMNVDRNSKYLYFSGSYSSIFRVRLEDYVLEPFPIRGAIASGTTFAITENTVVTVGHGSLLKISLDCSAGEFFKTSEPSGCIKCSPGSFSSSIASTNCTLCPADYYQPEMGATECLKCRFSTEPGATSCDVPLQYIIIIAAVVAGAVLALMVIITVAILLVSGVCNRKKQKGVSFEKLADEINYLKKQQEKSGTPYYKH